MTILRMVTIYLALWITVQVSHAGIVSNGTVNPTVGNIGYVSLYYNASPRGQCVTLSGGEWCSADFTSMIVVGDEGSCAGDSYCEHARSVRSGCDGNGSRGLAVGGCYTTPGKKNVTVLLYSCAPPWVPGGGELLDSWSGAITVSPRQPGAPDGTCNPVFDLIDPVAAGVAKDGVIIENDEKLADADKTVEGVAADGVTQVILRITTPNVGDTVGVRVVNENDQTDTADKNGGLYALGDNPHDLKDYVAAKAVYVPSPMAFVVYRAPTDFWRGSQDSGIERKIKLMVTGTDSRGINYTLPQEVKVVRPPVVLIHGLWSNKTEAWTNFNPVNNDENIALWRQLNPRAQAADYSELVSVTETDPSYFPRVTSVTGAALGFAFNAPRVLSQMRDSIRNYGISRSVAAVQADVVAHSMGGNIARTMEGLSGFSSDGDYGLGPVHKLITIATPHLGTPLARDLLPDGNQDLNSCVRGILKLAKSVSLATATVSGSTVNGAVGDLRWGIFPSQPTPTAYIAGSTTAENLQDLDSGVALAIHIACGILLNPVALRLTSTGWNDEFSGEANDGIVPVSSQLSGLSSALLKIGVIHSPGTEQLNLRGPSELDYGSGIPDQVIDLLNEPVTGSDFH